VVKEAQHRRRKPSAQQLDSIKEACPVEPSTQQLDSYEVARH